MLEEKEGDAAYKTRRVIAISAERFKELQERREACKAEPQKCGGKLRGRLGKRGRAPATEQTPAQGAGEASSDFDSTTLDGGVYESKDLTGYASGGTVKCGLFYDPALAGHQALIASMSVPATGVWKIKYSDAGPSSLTFDSAGVGFDTKVVMKDGLKGTLTLNRTGQPTRA